MRDRGQLGLYLTATYFEVENYFDRLTINGTRYWV